MRIPTIRGLIDRRVLVNFRVDPQVLTDVLPSPFRPQIVRGFGIVGICLIRLKNVRPKFLPAFVGISSENAAHRVAVEWESNGETHTGVFIPRRDTSSFFNAVVGGRLFPGVHNRAHFDVREAGDNIYVSMRSYDASTCLLLEGNVTAELPTDSVFPSLIEASQFFKSGSLGYSPNISLSEFDGLELRCSNWHMQPLNVSRVESSFFDDRSVFPVGSVNFDNALVMRNIEHEWHRRPNLCGTTPSVKKLHEPVTARQ